MGAHSATEWGSLLRVLFPKNMWLSQGSSIYLQQVKEIGDHIQSSTSQKGGLALVHIHYVVNYMLISSFQLATFTGLSSCQLHPVYSLSAKYCAKCNTYHEEHLVRMAQTLSPLFYLTIESREGLWQPGNVILTLRVQLLLGTIW